MNGKVKRLVSDKGFGFIEPEDGKADVFFHSSALVGWTFTEVREGEMVSFDIEPSDKGPRAVNVQRAA